MYSTSVEMDQKGIECEIYKHWFHANCIDIEDNEYTLFDKSQEGIHSLVLWWLECEVHRDIQTSVHHPGKNAEIGDELEKMYWKLMPNFEKKLHQNMMQWGKI